MTKKLSNRLRSVFVSQNHYLYRILDVHPLTQFQICLEAHIAGDGGTALFANGGIIKYQHNYWYLNANTITTTKTITTTTTTTFNQPLPTISIHFHPFPASLAISGIFQPVPTIYIRFQPFHWCIKSIYNGFAIAKECTLKVVLFGFCPVQVMPLFRISF